ncbi:cytochrome C [Saccharospirillum sp. MSK14-1]|uniref:c-type cytochrome n=1 Tax=Saccharospirillum sp. MSK14-1 TaxID=1897632 RepID=UPI000D3B7F42|nr:c-type cytochrome [Saccharospirillum sp. MSK14-1]PTY37582.1 cytochrome C [Saccharospirillum sp. MSK14-1]
MKKLIVGLVMLAGVTGLASAEEGDAARGETLVQQCTACHGAAGASTISSNPKLAGQGEAYLLKQLQDIQSGARVVTLMAGQLDNLEEQDLADIAAYYSEQDKTVGTADPDLVELGEQLYRGGNPETGVPACAGCHSPTGSGNAPAAFPMLSGQHADYIASQLHKFQAGYRADEPTNDARTNDGESMMMRATAFRLKDFEIEALASYINGLH